MTPELYNQVKTLITEKLSASGATIEDPQRQNEFVAEMALIFDQLLYEQARKKVPYKNYRKVYQLWHADSFKLDREYTIAGLSIRFGIPKSTVYQIVQGEFWHYQEFTPVETAKVSTEITEKTVIAEEPVFDVTHYLDVTEDGTFIKEDLLRVTLLSCMAHPYDAVEGHGQKAYLLDAIEEISDDNISFAPIGKLKCKDCVNWFGSSGRASDGKYWVRLAYKFKNGETYYTKSVQSPNMLRKIKENEDRIKNEKQGWNSVF